MRLRFSSNSEVSASKLLEYLAGIFRRQRTVTFEYVEVFTTISSL